MTTTDKNMSQLPVTEGEKGRTKQPTTVQPRVVIVGSGFGGLRAARTLRNAPVQITVIDKNNHHLFQPLLYQVATAGLSPADISAPIRGILRKQANTRVLMAEVTAVDTQEQRVITGDTAIPYDYLIVATGARHSYFGHNEWEAYAPGLKSITDATSVRRDILLAFEAAERESDLEKRDALLTFVLVGAGPTGVEMAGAIAELAHKALVSDFRNIDPKSARIILVEAGPKILTAYPDSQAHRAQKALNHLGVEVRTSAPVENITGDGVVIAGKFLAAKTAIWTAGVAASAAGQWLDAEVDRAGRVKVAADLSLPDHPNVFVIGDTASVIQDGKQLPGVAPVAMQEGSYVASLIAQKVAGNVGNAGNAGNMGNANETGKTTVPIFHYHDKGSLATVGRSFGIVDIGRFRLYGFFAWMMWLVIHIFYLIGFRNRFVVMFQWAWAYLTFQRGARLITFDTNPNKPV